MVGKAAARKICSTSAVVVVLPFDPVMPMSGHAGTRDDQILMQECFFPVATQLQRDACVSQPRDVFANLGFGASFGCGHERSARRAEQSRRDTGPRQSDNQYAFVVQLHRNRCYLNFSVVNANSAKISAMIQNLTITFDSLQPINSK
jgi:hypothetical protein